MAEIYQASGSDPGLTPLPSGQAPSEGFQAAERLGGAMQGVGQEADQLAYRLARARDTTNEMNARADIVTGVTGLSQKYASDTDFKTAPDRFAADLEKLRGDVMAKYGAGMSPPMQASLNYFMTHMGLNAGNSVHALAINQEAQSNVAAWGDQSQAFGKLYLQAGSDAQRASIEAQGTASIQKMADAGWINPEQAQKMRQGFAQNLQEMRLAQILQNPNGGPQTAAELLKDPNAFPAIPAARRVDLQGQTAAAINANAQMQLSVMGKMNPNGAVAAMGIVNPADAATVATIFDKGVVGQESQGNAAIGFSPAGAAGLAQLMPGTAREAARRMGRNDIAAMREDELPRFLADPANVAVNRALGLNEFQFQLARYGGNLPLALIGYNAGPGVADKVKAQALAQFGPTATPDQIRSLAPAAETRDYVASIYKRLGAPTNAFGLTGNSFLAGQSHALDLSRQENAANDRMLSQAAALHNSDDPVVDYIQQGYAVSPQRFQGWVQDQQAAAAAGDAGAAQRLRQADLAIRAAPVMQAAFETPPSQLAAWAANERQRLSTTTGWSPQDAEKLDVVNKVLATTDAMKDKNPVGLAERANLIRTVPVDFAQAGTPAFADALAARGPQALAAAQTYDGAILPLKPEEAFAGKQALANMGPDGKAALFAQMATNLKDPRVYEAAVKQLAGADGTTAFAGRVAARDPELGRRMLEGVPLLDLPGVKPKVQDVRDVLAAMLPDYPSTSEKANAIDGALALYASNRNGNGALFDRSDRAGMETALREITGPVVRVNGRETPIAPGISPAAVTYMMPNITAETLKPFGGLQADLTPADVGAHAVLIPKSAGDPVYAVQMGGRPVFTADGRPLVVDLKQMATGFQAGADAWEAKDARPLPTKPGVAPQLVNPRSKPDQFQGFSP